MPFKEGFSFELDVYDGVANSRDAEGGLFIFFEKRRPSFKGE